jgi:hypothetical protein
MACVFVDAGAFTGRCVETAASARSAIPDFGHYVTIFSD